MAIEASFAINSLDSLQPSTDARDDGVSTVIVNANLEELLVRPRPPLLHQVHDGWKHTEFEA